MSCSRIIASHSSITGSVRCSGEQRIIGLRKSGQERLANLIMLWVSYLHYDYLHKAKHPFYLISTASMSAAKPHSQLLSEVGVRRPLQEARELIESTYGLRGDVLQDLLLHCTSVKTVRLCLQLGREFPLPWLAKLDPAKLPIGSNQPWVARSGDGLLVLKP